MMTHKEILDEIEKKYVNQTMMPETQYLFNRVKKLTEALERIVSDDSEVISSDNGLAKYYENIARKVLAAEKGK